MKIHNQNNTLRLSKKRLGATALYIKIRTYKYLEKVRYIYFVARVTITPNSDFHYIFL